MSELDKYKRKLQKAEQKVRILEEMIEMRTRELYSANVILERTNTELEQFAYVASHDLQEPLRTVSSFVELLDKQYKGQLDENADRYLRYINASTSRMQNLIKGLLDLSRIGRNNELTTVDCNAVIGDIIADMDSLIKEHKAQINYTNLPSVTAYETYLRQLFQNLISNGIKFSKPSIAPEIHISAIQQNGKWEFSVQDNGIGIDPKHHDRIFAIFQRLHNKDEYEGTGIGLAHCKKIAELHGGDIRMESTPDKGSTFYFTISN